MNKIAVGSRIRAWRKARGWTLMQLAKEAGVSKGFMSEVENGKHCLGSANLLRLCAALGASVADLAGDAEAEPTGPKPTIVPAELVTLATDRGWDMAWVKALLGAKAALVAQRANARANYTTTDWERLSDALRDYRAENQSGS